MSGVRPEKLNCPYAVVRVNTDSLSAADPEWSITIVSLFDEEHRATEEVERLQTVNAGKKSLYFKQRVKKYFRGSS